MPHAPLRLAAPARIARSARDAHPACDACSHPSPAPLVARHVDVDSPPPPRLALRIAPPTQTSATHRRRAPIHLLWPLPRPVPPMSFAPTTSTSLRGIELCVGVKLCTDKLFTTVCFTRFRCTFHVFHQDVAYIAMATHACFKCMFHMFQLF
jgi:hypothetical protein